MKLLQILFISSLALAACESQPPSEDMSKGGMDLSGIERPDHSRVHLQDDLVGTAQPWLLERETSNVRLSDYFLDLSQVESVRINQEMKEMSTDGLVEILNPPKSAGMCNMEVIYAGHRYDIPLFASSQMAVNLNYTPTSPDVQEVRLAGNFNGWNPVATKLEPVGDSFQTSFFFRPGDYEYQVVEDGEWKLDHNNPLKKSNGQGGENSILRVGDPFAGGPMIYADSLVDGGLIVKAEMATDSLQVYWEDQLIESVKLDQTTFLATIPEVAREKRRSHLRIWGCQGIHMSNNLLIPLENGKAITDPSKLTRDDRQTNIMYFAMVDRFNDGDTSNNEPVDDPSILPKANHLGGDLQGITRKIKDGYFNQIGMNTIWVSPITQNAEGAWGLWDKGITSKFSGYHGYWPVSSTHVDRHFGDEAALNELIDVAHENDMNVVVDYVANHVHENHPVYQQHKDWATDLYLPDGTMNTEKWDEHRLTTWFDTFLPTLDFSKPEVVEAMTDSAMYWVTNYDLDGFRHDATKHIQEEFWLTLTRKMKEKSGDGTLPYQIGETYGSHELIRSYIGTGMLDAQFNFNLYDAAVNSFAKDTTGFQNLCYQMKESLAWYGHHNTMGNMTGNQDRPRYTSLADGSVDFGEDTKLAGWTREINNNGQVGYDRMADLMVFLMTVPGIPCVYYGDEIAMPGGNDPDNRRMMAFDGLTSEQQSTRDLTGELAKLRRDHMALMYGDTHVLPGDNDFMVIFRKYLDDEVMIVFYKGEDGSFTRERPEAYIDLAEWAGHFGGSLTNLAGDGTKKGSLEFKLPEGRHYDIFFRKN